MGRRAGFALLLSLGALLAAPGAQAPARSAGAASALAQLSSRPDRTYVANGPVDAVARAGNTIYLGGEFSELGPRTGPFVEIDPSTGKVQGPLPEVSGGLVDAVASDGSGGWYIGGSFTHVGGTARLGLAHILANGSLDSSFDPAPNGQVLALLFLGGTLYVGGNFTSIGGQSRANLAQLDASGDATSWNPAPNEPVDVLVGHTGILATTTIFVGGEFSSIGGQSRAWVAQLNLNGTPTSWNPSPNGPVTSLAVTGGIGPTPLRVYAAGDFTSIGGQSRSDIAQIDGSGDATTWNAAANGLVDAVAVSGSTVYVGGSFTSIGGQTREHIAALDSTTGDATSWNPNSNGTVESLAVSGSTVYAGGQFSFLGVAARDNLAAIDSTTGAATSWNPDANGGVLALALSQTEVYAGGRLTSLGGTTRNNLAAINAATGAPTSWNPGTSGLVEALAVSNGTVYVGGNFTTAGGAIRSDLAAIDASSGEATGWAPDPNSAVDTIAVSGSTVYVGGFFTSVGGQTRSSIAALDSTTGEATSWDPNSDGTVVTLAVAGSTVYAGGSFFTIGGQTRHNLAALDATTGAATAWDPEPNSEVMTLAVSGSTVYIGGGFTQVGTFLRHDLAAIETNGAVDAWNPDGSPTGSGFDVRALAVAGSTVYVGGSFFSIGGTKRFGLAAVSTATGLPSSWNPSVEGGLVALEAYPDGSVYVGGLFDTMDLAAQQGFASFSEPPADTTSPAITGAVHVGQQLTCSQGSWSGSTPQTYAYAWLRDGTAIGGATSTTYKPTLADAGHKLTCQVTAKNLGGSDTATSAPASVPPAPSATTAAATAITQAHATLHASVNPGGEATTVDFQYGKTTSYGATTAAQSVGSGTSAATIAADVSGLAPATTYHFRVVASSVSGTTMGTDETFTTSELMCVVPKVTGKKLKPAERAIRSALCSVGKVRKVYSTHVKKGRVIGEKPKAHAVKPVHTRVKLTVSKGRKP